MDFTAQTPQQLGEILRGFRQQRDLTQEQLASQLGLDQKAISTAENHAEKMGVARLFQLLSALGIQVVVRDLKGRPKTQSTDW